MADVVCAAMDITEGGPFGEQRVDPLVNKRLTLCFTKGVDCYVVPLRSDRSVSVTTMRDKVERRTLDCRLEFRECRANGVISNAPRPVPSRVSRHSGRPLSYSA